ncbi:MAG TPA: hypothetical protein VKB64_07155 [Gaiellaceae bacterium]|nr:hypothetical protein [Gaiellaceae bacterium]
MAPVVEWVEGEFLERSSHALLTAQDTWLVDPVDNPRVDELQSVVGVLQLLDRHNRDCAGIAERLGVRHVVLPRTPIPPFAFISISRHEVALWWGDERVLVCGDALGTARYFRAGDERLAVHPLLRLRPPRLDVHPDVILCGHGPGVFADADAVLREALRTSRRRIPQQFVSAVRAWRNRNGSR